MIGIDGINRRDLTTINEPKRKRSVVSKTVNTHCKALRALVESHDDIFVLFDACNANLIDQPPCVAKDSDRF